MSKKVAQAVETNDAETKVTEPNDAAPVEKHIPLKLRVFMTTFTDDKGKESNPYLAAELVDPFPEYAEEFNHVRIAPRWKRDIAVFKFRMKVALRGKTEVFFDGYCEPVGFVSKKEGDAGTMVYYPGIFFQMPYAGEPVEFAFKLRPSGTGPDGKQTFEQSPDSFVFRDIVSEKWGGSYEPAVSNHDFTDEDMPF